MLKATPTPYRKPQPREKDPVVISAVRSKFDKFQTKGYVTKGTVKGLTSFFTVPKGEGDIRLVFDGMKSRLNNVIWASSFTLPSVNSLLSALEPDTWMANIVRSRHSTLLWHRPLTLLPRINVMGMMGKMCDGSQNVPPWMYQDGLVG